MKPTFPRPKPTAREEKKALKQQQRLQELRESAEMGDAKAQKKVAKEESTIKESDNKAAIKNAKMAGKAAGGGGLSGLGVKMATFAGKLDSMVRRPAVVPAYYEQEPAGADSGLSGSPQKKQPERKDGEGEDDTSTGSEELSEVAKQMQEGVHLNQAQILSRLFDPVPRETWVAALLADMTSLGLIMKRARHPPFAVKMTIWLCILLIIILMIRAATEGGGFDIGKFFGMLGQLLKIVFGWAKDFFLPMLVLFLIWYKTSNLGMLFSFALFQIALSNPAVPPSYASWTYPLRFLFLFCLYILLDKLVHMCAAGPTQSPRLCSARHAWQPCSDSPSPYAAATGMLTSFKT